MPTSPFSAALITKLSGAAAWRFSSELGPVFTPRFFCCTDPNNLGIDGGKEPVAVISLTPKPAHVNEVVVYDGSNSYDPDGSVVAYAWDFEDGTPASGTAISGNVSWSAPGTYTVELVVTDGTSLSSTPARVEMVITTAEFTGWVATSSGIYYSDGLDTPPEYSLQLACNAYRVKVDPISYWLEDSEKVLWGATVGSVVYSPDGGDTWSDVTPGTVTNTWSDSPAPQPDDLTYKDIAFGGGQIYVAAEWQNGGGDWRSWVFLGIDGGGGSVTWSEF